MQKTYTLLLIFTILIFVQCQAPNNKSISIESHSDTIPFFENNLTLHGRGESEIASFYLDWHIQLLDNDSIIMLSSLKKDEKDVRLNNRQYFGRLVESEKYSYQIKISKFFGIDGCDKPDNRYLDTDTISFYIDSTLLNSVGFWKLKIDTEEDTLLIKQTNFLYKTKLNDSEIDLVMSLIPNKKSGLFPVTIISGLRCGVYLTDKRIKNNYYLNEIDGKYELIIDRTIPNGMEDKECDYCIKKVDLNGVE